MTIGAALNIFLSRQRILNNGTILCDSSSSLLKENPEIKCTLPSSPDYASDRKIYLNSRTANPLAIAHPESAEQVSALARFLRSHGIKFTVRGGCHNLQGLCIEEDALTIDMRAFTSVKIAADRQTATVGGGILQDELSNALWSERLATPTGSIPSVGYVGWAMYGGYGPFSSSWGLGADQIVAATVVDASGRITEADETLLNGIRGAGGAFGLILDVSIKVYPLKTLFAGVIMYDSQDIRKTLAEYNAKYRKLSQDGLPKELTLQQMVFNSPQGKLFGVSFTWSSEDIEEGSRWRERIGSLGTLLMNTVSETTIPQWYKGIAALVPATAYGSFRTHNLHEIPPEVAECLGHHLAKMPSDPAAMFTIYQSRMSTSTPISDSVFPAREPHFMLEIIGCSTTKEKAPESEQWALDLWSNVSITDKNNFLSAAYISLEFIEEPPHPATLGRLFGSHVDDILATKKRYDPENVFDLTVPRLSHYL
ncbi:6-hydroxy-D-nicotine oxidase, putative [Talaromyces stipitatus ATCC 10500]|uniref:6-hydroxy-D-nicotine oxidase, putative n=1 Tax=Talaromyces stipitatus (strain ATCC 10500 / CBS 375.48 / QM 6759 / NRRL 1006) TaxID=441959 RepID=B8M5M7_TALSN|nr:6-hydroxy-D-nicotine oxidase, putative [Talaromyces stipitatus ATCC 10500]EED19921.1 6-hydroxy-D-nicotine oxidase, putative [Talaromyces stipitatus ATCC 10500]